MTSPESTNFVKTGANEDLQAFSHVVASRTSLRFINTRLLPSSSSPPYESETVKMLS